MNKRGFTLIELLVVIAIIGILATIVFQSFQKVKQRAYYSRSLAEFKTIVNAIELYKMDHDDTYPEDVNRSIPPGLETYLNSDQGTSVWPKAPWPGSVYDWENWDDPDNYGGKIYQISIRFCSAGGDISSCKFPDMSWADNFGVNSALYYCISGNCRSHINELVDYPGYCVNCGTEP